WDPSPTAHPGGFFGASCAPHLVAGAWVAEDPLGAYRTVCGVNGPLVVLDNVKVRAPSSVPAQSVPRVAEPRWLWGRPVRDLAAELHPSNAAQTFAAPS
uniref:Uncharacterized protein n=1 Tax=Anas platyrhynchos platyrhynchos TaxID=8840 RepID=A0A493T9X4_ANAPP